MQAKALAKAQDFRKALALPFKFPAEQRVGKLRSLFKSSWVGIYVAVVIVTAQLVLLLQARAGVYVNAAAFAALCGLALTQERARQLAISAAILPVANMVVLSLPPTSGFARLTVFYDTLLLLGLVYRFMFTLDFPAEISRLSAKGYAMLLPLMVVIGQVLGAAGYGLLRHHYDFGSTPLPLVAVSALVFAAAEETFFRGLIQQRGASAMPAGLAAGLAVVLYTAASIGRASVLAPLFSLVLGTALSLVYYKKSNLMLTLVLNATTKLVYIALMAAFVFR